MSVGRPGDAGADVVVERVSSAAPATLYGLVSDVTLMGQWSPETTSCRWLPPATGPAVGSRFRGANRNGWQRWATTCVVVAAEPERRFAFEVLSRGRPASRWDYEFVADGSGCRIVESWTDLRSGWLLLASPLVTGALDRSSHNRAGMHTTLAALARAAERPTAGNDGSAPRGPSEIT